MTVAVISGGAGASPTRQVKLNKRTLAPRTARLSFVQKSRFLHSDIARFTDARLNVNALAQCSISGRIDQLREVVMAQLLREQDGSHFLRFDLAQDRLFISLMSGGQHE